MKPAEFCRIAGRLMRHPAVPFHEAAVRDEIENICNEHGLDFSRDRFGNVLVSLRRGDSQRPLVLAAHMDHPGFIVRSGAVGNSCLNVEFHGGVPDQYFQPGQRVRLMPGNLPARLGERKGNARAFEIAMSPGRLRPISISKPAFAVWDLEPFGVRSGRIHGRACDDLVGVAAALGTIIELKRNRTQVNVIAAICRAEEIGFLGALALASSDKLPKRALVISLETSRELPGVKMGQGSIIRVGDRASTFDSEATRYLSEVASLLKQRHKMFQYQRALMSGGTCEATAYQEFGFQTAALCVALGNYHNCAKGNRIAAEFVSVSDACGMVDLLVETASEMKRFNVLAARLPKRLKLLLRRARTRLVQDLATR